MTVQTLDELKAENEKLEQEAAAQNTVSAEDENQEVSAELDRDWETH